MGDWPPDDADAHLANVKAALHRSKFDTLAAGDDWDVADALAAVAPYLRPPTAQVNRLLTEIDRLTARIAELEGRSP